MDIIDIHYSEIGIKGNNRNFFEGILIENIRKALKKAKVNYEIRKEYKHIILETKQIDLATSTLKNVFGIRYFRLAKQIDRDYKKMEKEVLAFFKTFGAKKTFKIVVNRVDKKYERKSMDIALDLGRKVCETCDVESDLENPDFVYNIDIQRNCFVLGYERIEGLGGLPVGSTGKVVCLVSGGIDSPVATWMMMKRGCIPILYTVNCTKDKSFDIVYETKEILEKYSPDKIKLFAETVDDFNKIVLRIAEERQEPYNCLAFKYFLLHRAQKLANEEGALGLVTGDNLAQVASQTLENLDAQRQGIIMPVYSPLIGMDKEEIIDLSKKAGFFETSIKKKEDYFFLPKNPIIHSKEKDFKRIRAIIDKYKD